MKREAGFTLMEVLVVLVIVGILVRYALPSYQILVHKSRLTEQTNALLTSLYTARSEAIKRSTSVTLCASSDQATCTGKWNQGWIVFVPPKPSAPTTAPSAVSVIAVQQALGYGNTAGAYNYLAGSPVAITYIQYDGNGMSDINGAGNQTGYFEICDSKNTAIVPAQGVVVSRAGRPLSSQVDPGGTAFTCPPP